MMIELLLQAEQALSVGLVDQAERSYRQAAEADPRNSIAVVGLARVALERGDHAEALRLARGALEIDPENAAAARLVARLEEVLAHRGQPQVLQPPVEPVRPPVEPAPQPAEAAPSGVEAGSGPPHPEPVSSTGKASTSPSLVDRLLRRQHR